MIDFEDRVEAFSDDAIIKPVSIDKEGRIHA